ncbi:MAG: GNAT family N-acetyltransferase [Burkholderiales bacterium]
MDPCRCSDPRTRTTGRRSRRCCRRTGFHARARGSTWTSTSCSSAGAILGTAGIEVYGDVGLLRSVAVAPVAQNGGLGAAMVNGVLADAQRHRLGPLYVLTKTAARYFARRRFVPVSRHDAPAAVQASAEFQDACPATAAFMALDLAATR